MMTLSDVILLVIAVATFAGAAGYVLGIIEGRSQAAAREDRS